MHFLETHNDALVAYVKTAPGNTIIVVVSLDPFGIQEGSANLPAELGCRRSSRSRTSSRASTRLADRRQLRSDGPAQRQAHVLRVVG